MPGIEEFLDDSGTDEAGCAGDEDFHVFEFLSYWKSIIGEPRRKFTEVQMDCLIVHTPRLVIWQKARQVFGNCRGRTEVTPREGDPIIYSKRGLSSLARFRRRLLKNLQGGFADQAPVAGLSCHRRPGREGNRLGPGRVPDRRWRLQRR